LSYEVFERQAVRVDTPTLSIAAGGRVAFNVAACRILIDGKVTAVTILWDRNRNRIAVKAASKNDKNSFTVTFTGGNHSASFTAKLFLRHIGWNGSKRIALATTWNAAERMFEAALPAEFVDSNSANGQRRLKKT
jgi:hypothetical protein